MEMKIIAEASRKIDRVLHRWGLSVLIGNEVLLDTFSQGSVLIRNLRRFRVDIARIRTVVISHEHWDHTGGLWDFLKLNHHVTVFVGKHFSPEIKNRISSYGAKVTEITGIREIAENIFSTGELEGKYKGRPIYEQSLVVKGGALTLITGCAHPGITRIITHTQSCFQQPVETVIGGFHLAKDDRETVKNIVSDLRLQYGIKKAGPCHCTGKEAVRIFQQGMGDGFIKVKTGAVIPINE